MNNRLAFPMYAVDSTDTLALWRAVQRLLVARGLPVEELIPGRPEPDLLAHWQQPNLILSQTCGYPLMTQLPEVQVVGCFHYRVPGCEGIHYRSFWWYVMRINTARWLIFADGGWYVTRPIPSLATMRCATACRRVR